ncbi:monosaccharide-sensing protein 2 [Klebsormidium nitens]|uniref:Monosaccharide-sensing protein 2 n=1 Tax=Klebsormidium nitens TaxID=105231 RepID=A0A1Y1I8L7_KLENI|nr:monosaccharide-sensing protein 2 [Klebsormidium nitens]|eukprot:GAQ86873.1 monosaccharide-sensing protein 2 [Klebsormidium nitens]
MFIKSALVVALAASFGNYLQGYDSGCIAGALLYIQPALHLEDNPSLAGAIVSATLVGGVVSTLFAGPSSDKFGRKRLLQVCAAVYFLGACVSGWSPNVWVLIAGRAIIGLAIGIVASIVGVYVAECASASERGRLTTFGQLMGSTGMVLSQCVTFYFSLAPLTDVKWRLMLGFSAVPASFFFALAYLLPESPRWLASKGRLIEARHIFQHLRGREDVSDELGLVIENMEVGPSPLEEWLIKPEDVKPSGLATPMTPGSGTTKSLGVSIPLVDEEVAAIQALEEARARAAFLAIAEGRELSYRAPLEAVFEDIEKGVAAGQHTEATSVPATPIFEQTTILSVDWSAVQGSPHGTPQRTPRRQSAANVFGSEPEDWKEGRSHLSHAHSGMSSESARQPGVAGRLQRLLSDSDRHTANWASGELDEADIFNQEERLTASRRFRDSPADSGRDTPQKITPQKSGKETPGLPRPEKKPLSRQDSARDAPDAPAPAARQLSELLQAKSQAVRGDVADKLNKLPTVVVHQVPSYSDLAVEQDVSAEDLKPPLSEAPPDDEFHCKECETGAAHHHGLDTATDDTPLLPDLKTGQNIEVVEAIAVGENTLVLGVDSHDQEVLLQKLGPTAAAAVPAEVLDTEPDLGTDLFEPGVQRALLVGVGLQAFQQLCGINAVLYFTPTILKDAGVGAFFEHALGVGPESASILATGLTYVVMIPAILRAMVLMDSSGRRTLLLGTIPVLTISVAVLAVSTGLLPAGNLRAGLAVCSIAVYCCAFVMGLGPVPTTLCSEIFPTRVRGVCIGISIAAQWFFNFVVSQSFPILKVAIGLPSVFGIYSAICATAYAFVYVLVPETKGLSMEAVCEYFSKAAKGELKGRKQAVHKSGDLVTPLLQ